jgi:hypothetical protein
LYSYYIAYTFCTLGYIYNIQFVPVESGTGTRWYHYSSWTRQHEQMLLFSWQFTADDIMHSLDIDRNTFLFQFDIITIQIGQDIITELQMSFSVFKSV